MDPGRNRRNITARESTSSQIAEKAKEKCGVRRGPPRRQRPVLVRTVVAGRGRDFPLAFPHFHPRPRRAMFAAPPPIGAFRALAARVVPPDRSALAAIPASSGPPRPVDPARPRGPSRPQPALAAAPLHERLRHGPAGRRDRGGAPDTLCVCDLGRLPPTVWTLPHCRGDRRGHKGFVHDTGNPPTDLFALRVPHRSERAALARAPQRDRASLARARPGWSAP